jgi:anaerobic magnesium-protoporphyrin IX monomethyl ester cyclase
MSSKTANILLIAPQTKVYRSNANFLEKSSFKRAQPWLGLGYLAAVLIERGHRVTYLDATLEGFDVEFDVSDQVFAYGLEFGEIRRRILEIQPQIVGITCLFSSQSDLVLTLARAVKEVDRSIVVVVGGIHASYLPASMLAEDAVDYVVCGEGEHVLAELVEWYLRGRGSLDQVPGIAYRDRDASVRITAPATRVPLSHLPAPARDIMPMRRYWDIGLFSNPYSKSKKVITLLTSRGCPERCVFCSSAEFFGHSMRFTPVEAVIEEIRYCAEVLGGEEFQFLDDTFTINRQRVLEICEGIKPLKISACTPNGIRVDYHPTKKREMFRAMKEAGFYQVTFAIESGNQWVLDHLIKKRLDLSTVEPSIRIAQEEGLLVHTFFMLGLPGETRSQMADTIRFAKSIQADSYSFSVTIPLPGTALWEVCEKQGLFLDGFDPADLLYRKATIRLPDVDAEELEMMARDVSLRLNQLAARRKPENVARYREFAARHRHQSTSNLAEKMDRFTNPRPG